MCFNCYSKTPLSSGDTSSQCKCVSFPQTPPHPNMTPIRPGDPSHSIYLTPEARQGRSPTPRQSKSGCAGHVSAHACTCSIGMADGEAFHCQFNTITEGVGLAAVRNTSCSLMQRDKVAFSTHMVDKNYFYGKTLGGV